MQMYGGNRNWRCLLSSKPGVQGRLGSGQGQMEVVQSSCYLTAVEDPAGVGRLTGCGVGKESSQEAHSLVTRTLTHPAGSHQGLCLQPRCSAEGRWGLKPSCFLLSKLSPWAREAFSLFVGWCIMGWQ